MTAPADPIQAVGTPEEEWAAWTGWERLPEAVLPRRGPVVVVAAHPDDEVLGCGGLMASLAEHGVPLRLVAVTDGEASHPGAALVPPELARRRIGETGRALEALGAGATEILRLGVPDTAVADAEASLRETLAELVAGAAWCLAPWSGDVHADHEAAGRAARDAAAHAGTDFAAYPVWMWHWARPRDPRVPWDRAVRVPLSPAQHRRKRAAAHCFTTQVRPLADHDGGPGDVVLPPEELAHHLRPFEVLLR